MAHDRILTAELLSIGSELTVGDTRDTNAGELARALTAQGVSVGRIVALPDRLDLVAGAIREALGRAQLVVSTGGLGPTPDDLTREAIAAVWAESPTVDTDTEAWLRDLWSRRGMPFPTANLKQAWTIPSATILPNPFGTAPGWLVRDERGRVALALPGPPREMRPMWVAEALPRLQAAGLGADVASTTVRLADIGESQVAEILGEAMLRATNPEVATYARVEAVDVRVSAVGGPDGGGTERTAAEHVAHAVAVVRARLGPHVWATGERTWSEAIGDRLATAGWSLGASEAGTGGQFAALLGDVAWLQAARIERGPDLTAASDPDAIVAEARGARNDAGSDVGIAIRALEQGSDLHVTVGVVTPRGESYGERVAFLGGAPGRSRAALIAARILLEALDRANPKLD